MQWYEDGTKHLFDDSQTQRETALKWNDFAK